MNTKRYRAHRALASVILGWVTFRVIAYQWADPNVRLVSNARPMQAPITGAIVHEPLLMLPCHLNTIELLDVPKMPIDKVKDASNMVYEMALSGLQDEPNFVSQKNLATVSGELKLSIDEFVVRSGWYSSPSRLNLYSWVFVRQHSPTTNFVPEGQLGGSQAGVRALYRLGGSPVESIAALSVRVTRPLAINNGAEAGLGLELQPIAGLPINVIFERRVRLEQGGRNAWSSFVAGGFNRQLPNTNWVADGYVQAGMVGARQRDGFLDGAIGLNHPFGSDPDLQIGLGAWGGIQPGVERLDIGPRLKGVLHTTVLPIQWEVTARMRVIGQVRPASGLALTISSGF